jgi:uncharacterized protein YdcH (DUF465 family)
MEARISHLIERFPDRADVIRALHETQATFKDLIGDHYEVCEELGRTTPADEGKRGELERRRAVLEDELMLLMQNHQRI